MTDREYVLSQDSKANVRTVWSVSHAGVWRYVVMDGRSRHLGQIADDALGAWSSAARMIRAKEGVSA